MDTNFLWFVYSIAESCPNLC